MDTLQLLISASSLHYSCKIGHNTAMAVPSQRLQSGSKSLFWLSYGRGDELVGVVIIEARALMEARMIAAIDGLDKFAEFAEGYALGDEEAAMISPLSIGRMLPPAEVGRLMAWLESEAERKGKQTDYSFG
jgi:hypothetical protein